jgi:dihydropteroate synthase
MAEVKNGPRLFDWGKKTYVMGIVNVTPDSFSGDGVLGTALNPIEKSLEQAREFLVDGVDMIDIGGESTRPGSKFVDPQEELTRVVPVVKAMANEFPQAVISVDTYKAVVAEAAMNAGAHIINDVWGLAGDPGMAKVAAYSGAWVILMHNRSKPENAQLAENLGGRYVGVEYGDLLGDVEKELQASINLALKAGVAREKIILDPGIGFGKTVEQNLELINKLDRIKKMGYPVLLAPSRKSFIGFTLNLPPAERMEGTAAAIAIGIDRGADIVRVHDVRQMVRVARMTDALVRKQ